MSIHWTHDPPKQVVALPDALAKISSKVLDDVTLRRLVDPDVYGAFEQCRRSGEPMPKAQANALATSIREWAQANNCIGYSHWFSPMRGPVHGEKLETFMALDFKSGRLMVNLTGAELFQTETDGSSFPNGGLRETHQAAAYMGWDTASPPFIYGQTLYIPSVFIAWSGDALDQKTPLLKANDALDKHALRLLRHLGDSESQAVVSNVGWEQEFFVIDREHYLSRPDLVATGRTLFGQSPLRGQQQSLNYFAKMPIRVRRYLDAARERMWELGISIDCAHNEVAPAQHEISPIFSLTNLAADTNVLAMEVLRDLAFEHDLAVLFHEKPFAGINGTGKHNNWGLNTDTGHNLFVPGETAAENRRFVAFVAALAHAVHKHGDLLRASVSSSGNDHRLGAQEAPPAIITLALGKSLEEHMRAVARGGALEGYGMQTKHLPVAKNVPDIKASLEDRNRTAPFPFCGNRFEFRAVGGNQHIAFPLAMVNAAMAAGLKHMSDRIDAGDAVDTVIRETIAQSEGVLFSGNGYSDALLAHAKQHGVAHLATSPEAYAQLTADKNIALFGELGIFSEREAHARRAVLEEGFATDIAIEARTMLRMLRTAILPAAMEDLRRDADTGLSSKLLDEKRAEVQTLLGATEALASTLDAMPDGASEAANYAQRMLRPAMVAARAPADRLEGMVDEQLWPYPTYNDLVHDHH